MSKCKVYISSTFLDLKEYRKSAIEYLNMQVSSSFELTRVMELMYDDGTGKSFKDVCVEEVKNSDLYFLILNNRIGSTPPGETRTYTEIEYDTALAKLNKKTNNFSIYRIANNKFDSSQCDDVEKYRLFQERLEGYPVHEFSDLESFENKFKDCIITYIATSRAARRSQNKLFFSIVTFIVLAFGIIAANVVYITFESLQWQMALLTFLLFSCIAAYTFSKAKYPTS